MSFTARRGARPFSALVGCAWLIACQFPNYGIDPVDTSAGGTTSGNATNLAGDAGTTPTGGAASSGASPGGASGASGGATGAGGDATDDPSLLFSDDFESGTAASWLERAGSPWSVVLDSERASQAYQLTPVFKGFYAAAAKAGPWANQVIEADVKVLTFGGTETTDVVSLLARFSDIDNYYAAVLRADGRAAIRAAVNGAPPAALKTSAAFGVTTGVWYHLRFEVIGSSLRLLVDGSLRVEIQNSSLAKGTVALGGNNSSAIFDDVRVIQP